MRDPHLATVLGDLDRLLPRAHAVVEGLDEAALHEPPQGGGWSIAQIFEHLCVTDQSYLDGPLPAALEKARRGPVRRWRPSLLGGFLRRSLARTDNRLKAPRRFRIGSSVRPGVVDEWRRGIRRLREMVVAADGADLNVRLSSPAARFVRMTLGDALSLPVVHGHRHLGQAERVRAQLGGARG